MATPIPMDYAPALRLHLHQQQHSQPHAHDIVFQQMVLRTAQALPAPPTLPLANVQISMKIYGQRDHQRSHRHEPETEDEGYKADRDNARLAADQPNVPKKPFLGRKHKSHVRSRPSGRLVSAVH